MAKATRSRLTLGPSSRAKDPIYVKQTTLGPMAFLLAGSFTAVPFGDQPKISSGSGGTAPCANAVRSDNSQFNVYASHSQLVHDMANTVHGGSWHLTAG